MNKTLILSAQSILRPGAPVDVSFVPPMARRRLSPLQKIFFALAHAVESTDLGEVVFASRDGEDTLTRRIVEDYQADGTVSPHRFSTSVYNAAPGLWSIQTANRSAYTAIAAGDDSIECGLLEALADGRPRTFVFAEETGGGFGIAVRFSETGEGRRIAMDTHATRTASLTFAELASFLEGTTRELCGRWIRLRECE